MAEKDYNTWLAEAKAALDSYSAQQEEIAKLYEQAKQNASASYDAQQKQLADRTTQSKNQAASDSKKTERNINQTLASRGLAFSGENAQTHLDLNLSLQNRLAALDRDASAQAQKLEQEKAKTLTELDTEHAKSREAGAEKSAQLRAQLANIAAQKAAWDAQSQTNTAAKPDKDSDTDASDTAPQIKPPDLTGKSLAERIKLMLQYVAQVKAQNNKQEESNKLTPTISARDLAKQLISSAGGSGSISGYDQQAMLEMLLNALTEEHDLDETYKSELLLNLQSMGYRPDYAGKVDSDTAVLCTQSYTVYTDYYDRYYKMYEMIGYQPLDCDIMAGEMAQYKQLLYVYERCESLDLFEAAADSMGLYRELDAFYERLEADPEEYKLGAEIDRR